MAAAENKIDMKAEIDLCENAVYIVKDGALQELPKPETGHGTHTISWQGGKPCHGKMEHSLKF
ncbi:DUF3954 domain-containing protein [Pontibacillus salipaludis]|uniref:DUF3954 domain-containing protein n=1 Tax=Pontibacillus salipaludis TaxID=1697394 RepID=A0ABQ1PWL4_9BACI|nr:DUF3954 domain-containing protein [Pontibacillus salipaludis]GGD05269.1 hypothetical protein GCM10011389_10980 [Pontibacillus salipaludis]